MVLKRTIRVDSNCDERVEELENWRSIWDLLTWPNARVGIWEGIRKKHIFIGQIDGSGDPVPLCSVICGFFFLYHLLLILIYLSFDIFSNHPTAEKKRKPSREAKKKEQVKGKVVMNYNQDDGSDDSSESDVNVCKWVVVSFFYIIC